MTEATEKLCNNPKHTLEGAIFTKVKICFFACRLSLAISELSGLGLDIVTPPLSPIENGGGTIIRAFSGASSSVLIRRFRIVFPIAHQYAVRVLI